MLSFFKHHNRELNIGTVEFDLLWNKDADFFFKVWNLIHQMEINSP